MYTNKGKKYADAGCVLQVDKMIGWQLNTTSENITERELNLDNIEIGDDFINIDGVITRSPKELTYSALKTCFVHLRYSNDDQMAIILNRELSHEDEVLYDKMQEWREWCGNLAKKCLETING